MVRGTFRRRLVGRGCVHGIRFRPGTFRQLLGSDVATLTDHVVPAGAVLGVDWVRRTRDAVDADDDAAAAAALDVALLARLGSVDPVAIEVADLVERVQEDRALTRVEQLADLVGVTPRTLQRTFARHVGVGPKWVVQTYRLHDAAAQLAAGKTLDLAALAAELGYSDQAHLTSDFRRAVGRPPGSYADQQRRDRAAVDARPGAE